jgi:GDP-L-fucose synthase
VMNIDETIYRANTQPMLSHINVGSGKDISILELALIIAQVTGFKGRIVFDSTKPDGAPRKLLDVSRLTNMGWTAQIGLEEGVRLTYQWFLVNSHELRTK